MPADRLDETLKELEDALRRDPNSARPRRVVRLTEDMIVDSPQQTLPLPSQAPQRKNRAPGLATLARRAAEEAAQEALKRELPRLARALAEAWAEELAKELGPAMKRASARALARVLAEMEQTKEQGK